VASEPLVVWAPDDPERALLDGLEGVRVEVMDADRLGDGGDLGEVDFRPSTRCGRRPAC
jgi:hypothetical protein